MDAIRDRLDILVEKRPSGVLCGSKTLLLEDCGFFGGVAAWGCGMQNNQMRPQVKPRAVDVKDIRARLQVDQVDLYFSGQTQNWLG